MQKTHLVLFLLVSGLSLASAQSDDCARLLREAADFEKNKQYDRALKKYLSAKEECDAATSAEVNRQVLAVFEKIEQQRQEAETAKRQAEANATRARNAERRTQVEKQKAERSSEANRLAALALSKAKTNPTLGRHLAAMAWEMSLDSSGKYCTEPGVVSVMHSIASDAGAWMYRPLKGHTGPVNDVVFSPDGQMIATCGADLTVRLWNMEGELLHTLEGHRQVPLSLAYSPDGKWIRSTERDTVYLWSHDGKIKRSIGLKAAAGNYFPTNAVFSPDSRYLLTANGGETAIVWRVETGDTVRVLSNNRLKKQINNAQYSPDGATLLLEGYDTDKAYSCILADTTGNTLDTLLGKKTSPNKTFFTPDGRGVFLLKSNFAYLKDLKSGKLDSLPTRYFDWRFAFSSQKRLFAYFDQTEAKVWDYTAALTMKNTFRYSPVYQNDLVFAWYDRCLVGSSYDGYIRFFDLDNNSIAEFAAHTGNFNLAVSPDSRYVASAGNDGRLLLWHRNMAPVLASPAGYLQLFVSPDGQRIVSGEAGAKRHSLNLRDAQANVIATLDVKIRNLNNDDVQFIPQYKSIAVRSADSTIRIFDFDGRLRSTLRDTDFDIARYFVSPSGERILVISRAGKFRVWTPKGEKIGAFENERKEFWNSSKTQFSPDGSQFCMLADSSVKLFDRNGKLSADISGRFESCGFSPTGSLLTFSYSPGYSMKIWDSNNRQILEVPISYLHKFSPKGDLLLTVQGNKVLLWDIARRSSQQWTLPSYVERMTWGHNGRLYLTTNNNQNYITYVQDVNGHELGRFSGAISMNEEKGFLPGNRLFCYKLKGQNTEYFQILDEDNRIVEILDGLPNMGGHDVSPDGRLKLAWDKSDRNKIIVWNEEGRPLRTLTSLSDNVSRAFFSPDGRYIVVKTNLGDELWETPASYMLRSKTLSAADLIRAGAGVNKDSVLSSNDVDILSEVADFYFYDRNDPDNAAIFYERLQSVRHTPRALMQLCDIALQTGRNFDIRRFSKTSDVRELTAYADFLRDRKMWNDARDLYEKSLAIKATAHCLFQLNVIADTLKQPFDFERYRMLTGNADELYHAAYLNYSIQKWSQARRLYEMSERERHLTENLLQLQRISEQTGQEPLDFNRLMSSENAVELEAYANHFLNSRQWAKAQPLFEKAESIQHNARYLNDLQMIADSLGQTFDFGRFEQMQHAGELNSSADFFFNRQEWKKAQILYEKAAGLEPTTNVYVFIRRVELVSKTGIPFDVQKALQSAERNFFQSAITETMHLAQDNKRSQNDILSYLDILRQLESKLFTLDTTWRTRQRIAQQYTGVAWENLFALRESHAKVVELASLRGLELVPDENTLENKVLKTNVPTALVLQGRFEEAWRNWYEPLKEREYGRNNYATFRDVFLGDIMRLEEAGVKHPDFGKVKTRLGAGGGG